MAVELVKALPEHGIAARCLFVYGEPGAFGCELGELATYLNLRSSKDVPLRGWQYRRAIQSVWPAIIHRHDGLTWPHFFEPSNRSILRIAHAHLDAGVRSFGNRTRLANWLMKRRSQRLICVSEPTRESWVGAGIPRERTTVIPNGVDTRRFHNATPAKRESARFAFGLPRNAFIIGFVGRLHSVCKGADDFLRVLAMLPGDVYALLVGAGEDERELKRLAQNLGLANRAVFVGAQADTASCYHAMDAFLLTSHFETFGLAVLEAMASEVPVFAFQCPGGVNEFMTAATSVVVERRSVPDLAQKILELRQYPLRAHSRSESARAMVENRYTWSAVAKRVATLYRESVPAND